jgi:hypothetical protein
VSAAAKRDPGPHPLTIIREAIEAARLQGIRIRIGSHGVEFAPDTSRWIRDPDEGGVDPIGAAILLKQPQLDDVDEAAAAAVNAPIPWTAGCSDGLQRREPADAWATSVKAKMYAAGYSAGIWLRSLLVHNVEPARGGGKVV